MKELNTNQNVKFNGTIIKTIVVPGSESRIYKKLLKHKPANEQENEFLKNLEESIKSGFKSFNVPRYAPSIDKTGRINFVPSEKPLFGYSYYELQEIARNNQIRIGNDREFYPFLGIIIYRLMSDCSEKEAFTMICSDDSKKLKDRLGASKFLLADDEDKDGFWVVGDSCKINFDSNPLARLLYCNDCYCCCKCGTAWFVI